MVKWWLSINLLFLFSVLLWSWQKELPSTAIITAKGMSQFALLFFLANINMYFIFLIIRKSKSKPVKVKLAKISRKLMKLHISLAISGTSLILTHALLMLIKHPLSLLHVKIVSGMLAIIVLCILLFTGYRRHKKASGFRRRSHIFMAFTFMFFVLIHIFSF